jgi:hypothetical protein
MIDEATKEATYRLFRVGGKLMNDGVEYREGDFIEVQTTDDHARGFMEPADVDDGIACGLLIPTEPEAEVVKGSERLLWDDVKAYIAEHGEVQAANMLRRKRQALNAASLKSIRAGLRTNDLKYRDILSAAVGE